MQDRAFTVLILVMAATFFFRIALLGEVRRWTSEQRGRLVDAFYRQNKTTTIILLVALGLLIVPSLAGHPSRLLALATCFVAAGVAVVGGAWGNRKLRRLGFPRRFVLLHAGQAATVAAGILAFNALLLLD